jgi:hypothetical protein
MLEVVKRNGCAIYYIEQQFRTDEIMMEAVKETAYAINYIEQKFRTDEIMMEAVKKTGYAIYWGCRIKHPTFRRNYIDS